MPAQKQFCWDEIKKQFAINGATVGRQVRDAPFRGALIIEQSHPLSPENANELIALAPEKGA